MKISNIMLINDLALQRAYMTIYRNYPPCDTEVLPRQKKGLSSEEQRAIVEKIRREEQAVQGTIPSSFYSRV